ncbi:MAG: ABC transporter ATP-binding protein, partial [Rothia dentocariosa]|nr:ABC transporter ATP-binding protein [Rothia dentocariosa]
PREFTVTLSTDKLELALPHVLSGIRAGCVESYRIGSASLADNYEEMINHD